jgi:hypothetical protein
VWLTHLHNPALRDDDKALRSIGAPRDLQADGPSWPQCPYPVYEGTGIGSVGPDMPQPRVLVAEGLQERLGSMPVLDTGGRHDDRQDQPEGIDEDMALAPLDLFARVVAVDPPFSVVLTD